MTTARYSSGNVYGCGKIVRTAEPVEILISEAVLYRCCDSPEVAQALKDTEAPEIGTLMDEYGAKKDRLMEVLALFGSGQLSKDQMLQAKAAAEDAIEQTRSKLARLESGRALASVPLDKTIREAWEGESLAWRRSLISLLIERVTVLPSSPGGMRWTAPDGRQWNFDPAKILATWRV
jgi:site-specific DNA recombinase